MAISSEEREFNHPYEPYDVQKQFMNAVYDCLEHGQVGILESPTGTGKSLSLICGSLTWLRDHKRRAFEDGLAADVRNDQEPDWMVEYARKQKRQDALDRRKELDDRIAKVKAKEKRIKEHYESGEPRHKKPKHGPVVGGDDDDDEAQYVLDDYESDNESTVRASGTFNDSGISAETQALMEKLGYTTDLPQREEEDIDETKIFFCSRTHSQLSQFASELRRVKLPPAILPEDSDLGDAERLSDDVKYLTLGSRKNLCINKKVSKLGSTAAINERCIELQQSKSVEGRCPYMPTQETKALTIDFRDHALAKVRDIEDMGNLGKRLGVCPYYASRQATKNCEMVTLPYPLLLQRAAREALGLSLKDHVVVIDEAHNLMDAIAGIYSVAVTLDQIHRARAQLTIYLQKFRNKLKGKNRIYVAQILRILNAIVTCLQSLDSNAKALEGTLDMATIMSANGVDQINIFKLTAYIQESHLARKVDGYTTYSEEQAHNATSASKESRTSSTPVLMHVQAFLLSLMNPSAEGSFFYSKEEGSSITIRYLLLDPTYHFRDIVEETRAVVLAGGTMSPMSDYEQHLLSYLDPGKITTLSCGHVIPPSNLLAIPVESSGRSDFHFTFGHRNREETCAELGRSILAFIEKIPDGVVVFFPSYSYLDHCVAIWKRLKPAGSALTYWDSFAQKKPVFCEQRSQPSAPTQTDAAIARGTAVESVLAAYSTAVATSNGRGALLFAVVGGSLSEGINFSDALGRGVVVVGLPFPNPHSAEWKAKMQYISSKESKMGGDGNARAKDFYENTCMRAVNQCVGRAIRHKGDYAAILMLDKRYGTKRIQDKLPKWIRASLVKSCGVRDVESSLEKFFAGRS